MGNKFNKLNLVLLAKKEQKKKRDFIRMMSLQLISLKWARRRCEIDELIK